SFVWIIRRESLAARLLVTALDRFLDRHPSRIIERQLSSTLLHDRRPASGTTLPDGGGSICNKALRASASVCSAMYRLYVRSIILTDVSCIAATTLIGVLATNCLTIELCRKALSVTTSGSSPAALATARKSLRWWRLRPCPHRSPLLRKSSGASLGRPVASCLSTAASAGVIGTARRSWRLLRLLPLAESGISGRGAARWACGRRPARRGSGEGRARVTAATSTMSPSARS